METKVKVKPRLEKMQGYQIKNTVICIAYCKRLKQVTSFLFGCVLHLSKYTRGVCASLSADFERPNKEVNKQNIVYKFINHQLQINLSEITFGVMIILFRVYLEIGLNVV